MRRHNPGAAPGAYRHYSTGSVDDLVAVVEMQGDDVTGGVVIGESDDRRGAVAGTVKDRALAPLRHLLTQ